MGSSESKVAASVSTPKPDPIQRIKNQRVAELVDPRSPTAGIDRTPIQMAGAFSKTGVEESSGSSLTYDPRSPTHGISRTPMKDSMKVTVSSFARRLGMLFLTESSIDEAAALPHVTFTKNSDLPVEELGFTEPLLTHYTTLDSGNCDSATTSDAHTPSQGYGSLVSSPFVLVGEVVELKADLSLEEAEDALVADSYSPIKKELSLSLLTCHDGMNPSQICVDDDCPLTPTPTEVVPSEQGKEDHGYALPTVSVEPVPLVSLPTVVESAPEPEISEAPVVDSPKVEVTEKFAPEPEISEAPVVDSPKVEVTEEFAPEPEMSEAPVVNSPKVEVTEEFAPEPEMSEAPVVNSPKVEVTEEFAPEVCEAPVIDSSKVEVTEEPEPVPQRPSTPKATSAPALPAAMTTLQPQALTAQAQEGIRCPTFDTKSPSQVVFKPQWLGVGFGATGVKPRGLQGRGKGSSSPLASRKPADSENQGLSVKPKQRGKVLVSDGRSPLQIRKETNSPRENSSQMKLKISTPDRQRLGQLDRRALIQYMNKENQR
ncbi:cell division cycle-associated protein 3 [Alosa sapidissima]|uniref:cell division cycle-associated protein 3 n=1 Tax=Alosa sapidissima TaxID=34773 RepID=UPI001C09A0B4|nr:cell division cycle-associated protein 3 [Alosa sapidissima]